MSGVIFPEMAAPEVKRALPSFSNFNASLDGKGPSVVVR
eukprot:CAMPEP_0114667168 /NCGR_PEP_ID=MMETSP0191-20121206/33882_1 /TAXON_ID=126664 /ORGANISM="Sorites sp." /LENGTH=38 /DNA_ID= /DNA_START= /DNA_END= /DNA_ORIENTATION=